jgi:hypothetical protein
MRRPGLRPAGRVLLAVLAGGAGAAAGGAAAGTPLAWRACPHVAAGLQCASLQVPLNYAQPGGWNITLALSRMPATAPARQRQGALLVNPGGAGGPGRAFAQQVAAGLSPAVAADFDIIGFDTRGTGASVPSLHCDPAFSRPPGRTTSRPAPGPSRYSSAGPGTTQLTASVSTAGCCRT